MSARATHISQGGRAILMAALLALFTLAGPCLAGETFKVVPSVSLRETYDSNVNFNGKGDFEHSATPGVRVDLQQERLRGWTQARGTAYKYMRLNEYDRVDQNYDAGLEVNVTERITLNAKGSATLDHAFSSSLGDTGERSPHRASRQLLNAQPSVTFALDETNALTLTYAFSKTDYDTQDYIDSLSNTFSGLWGYRLNERTQLLLQLSKGWIEASTAQQDIFSGMAGFEYALAETVKARVLAGASSMNTKPKAAEARTSSNFSADTSLEWKLETLTTSAGYSRDMTMGISGEDLVRDRLSLNFSMEVSERLQLALGGNLVLSENSSTNQTRQSNRWYEIRPTIRYRVGEDSNLSLGYSYGSTKDLEQDSLRTRNRIFLDYNISFP